MMTKLNYKKVCTLIIFLFCFAIVPSFALVDIRPSISFSGGGAFCIPTSSYLKEYPSSKDVKMPAIRTSANFGIDLKALELSVGDEDGTFSIGAGLSYVTISKSISYGASQLRPYSGFGAFVEFGLTSNSLSWTMLLRYLYCHFPKVDQVFVACEVEAIASFKLASFGACNLYVIAPTTFSVKSDATTIRLSCGLKIDYSVKKAFERGWYSK